MHTCTLYPTPQNALLTQLKATAIITVEGGKEAEEEADAMMMRTATSNSSSPHPSQRTSRSASPGVDVSLAPSPSVSPHKGAKLLPKRPERGDGSPRKMLASPRRCSSGSSSGSVGGDEKDGVVEGYNPGSDKKGGVRSPRSSRSTKRTTADLRSSWMQQQCAEVLGQPEFMICLATVSYSLVEVRRKAKLAAEHILLLRYTRTIHVTTVGRNCIHRILYMTFCVAISLQMNIACTPHVHCTAIPNPTFNVFDV